MDDLYPEPISRSSGSPRKDAAGRGSRSSPKKTNKNGPPVGNKLMTVELDVDPVTSKLRKTVGMVAPNADGVYLNLSISRICFLIRVAVGSRSASRKTAPVSPRVTSECMRFSLIIVS